MVLVFLVIMPEGDEDSYSVYIDSTKSEDTLLFVVVVVKVQREFGGGSAVC